MQLSELYDYKQKCEKEVIFAQAKVQVAEELIAIEEEKIAKSVEEDLTETAQPETITTSIY